MCCCCDDSQTRASCSASVNKEVKWPELSARQHSISSPMEVTLGWDPSIRALNLGKFVDVFAGFYDSVIVTS